MTTCINDDANTYSGRENSPLGLGYSPNLEFPGHIMNGKDGKFYTVKLGTKYKKWINLAVDLNNLPVDCYTTTKYPITKKIARDAETGLEEKLGGHVPFFTTYEGIPDTWPCNDDDIPLTFFGQFKDPYNKSTLLQIFVDVDVKHYQISEPLIINIELNDENIKNKVIVNKPETNNDNFDGELTTYDAYEITDFELQKEFKPLSFLYERLRLPQNDIFEEDYRNNKDFEPSSSLKFGGTSIHCQRGPTKNELLQLSYCEELPFNWGDGGIAHVTRGTYGGYDLKWDCY